VPHALPQQHPEQPRRRPVRSERGSDSTTAKAPDNDIANLPQTGSDQPVWWYDQSRKRGGDRKYSGHVNHSYGAEAERARAQLADLIRELLDWAAHQQSGDHSIEDGEAA
jgi:hypothetical protein